LSTGRFRSYFRGPMTPQARKPRSARPRSSATIDRRRATMELRALAHPLRLRLLEEFAGAARTTMQVAAAMGEPPTRLYHHVNALERAGILKLARTRQVRGTTEKYYEVAKKRVGAVDGANITGRMKGPMKNLTYLLFEEAKADLLAAIADSSKLTPETAPVAFRMLLTASPAQLASARRKLVAVLDSIRKECRRQPPPPDALRWALTVAFAPRGRSTQE
jgi:DNA-binding transcriptional ArsR family regulator